MSEQKSKQKRLYRSEKNRMLGGVAGGVAEYFNVDPTLVRLFFVLILCLWGAGIPVYLLLWIIIPPFSKIEPISEESMKNNAQDIVNRAEEILNGIKGEKKK
jgi:phage shock protein C